MYLLHKYRIAFNIVNTIQCFAQTKQEIRFLQTNPSYSAPSGCPDDAPCMQGSDQGEGGGLGKQLWPKQLMAIF
jgi:hypothetical protein